MTSAFLNFLFWQFWKAWTKLFLSRKKSPKRSFLGECLRVVPQSSATQPVLALGYGGGTAGGKPRDQAQKLKLWPFFCIRLTHSVTRPRQSPTCQSKGAEVHSTSSHILHGKQMWFLQVHPVVERECGLRSSEPKFLAHSTETSLL